MCSRPHVSLERIRRPARRLLVLQTRWAWHESPTQAPTDTRLVLALRNPAIPSPDERCQAGLALSGTGLAPLRRAFFPAQARKSPGRNPGSRIRQSCQNAYGVNLSRRLFPQTRPRRPQARPLSRTIQKDGAGIIRSDEQASREEPAGTKKEPGDLPGRGKEHKSYTLRRRHALNISAKEGLLSLWGGLGGDPQPPPAPS